MASEIATRLSDDRTGEVHPNSDSSAAQEFRKGIKMAGNHHQKHPNYLSNAPPQTGPMGTLRERSSFDLEERLNFNPRLRQQMWCPPSAAQATGVPSEKKVYRRIDQPENPSYYNELIVMGIVFATFVVLFY